MNLEISIKDSDFGLSYSALKSLLSKLQQIDSQKDRISLLKLYFEVDPNGLDDPAMAILWRWAKEMTLSPFKKEFHYAKKHRPFFKKVHFMDQLVGKTTKFSSKRIPINFETFRTSHGVSAGVLVDQSVSKILDKSKPFHSELSLQLTEIISNTLDHSFNRADAGVYCGKAKNNWISLAAVDMGQGIRNSFLSNPNIKEVVKDMSDAEAIIYATNKGISCNPGDNRHPGYSASNGGIGLYYLKKFVESHRECYLVIISHGGYYYIDGNGKEIVRDFVDAQWPGTMVYLKTNLREENSSVYASLLSEFAPVTDTIEIV